MHTSSPRILITGAAGQLGTELTAELQKLYGEANVIATDIRTPKNFQGIFENIDVTNTIRLAYLIDKYKITQIYHLVAILSAKGEQNPTLAWQINVEVTRQILEIAREKRLEKVYVPSSIAVFGDKTPKHNAPQYTILNPSTIYGVSKLTCEMLFEYYYQKYNLDVRSLRYPGIISYKAMPGGGTTDYAIDIFHKAVARKPYECFLKPDTYLPMIYMPDALQATLQVMHAEAHKLRVRTSYNIGAMTFSPRQIFEEIQKHLPEFQITYQPDFRQQIADSWVHSIDDSFAREDWGWQPTFDLPAMVADMLVHLQKREMAWA
ncbi:MAG: NAD-dependent epimerase/dehydratase family protein [Microscillaceae bacterium]|nr:NAD-dependent epimerase/dehydratase family protein [Microscillaceae bacterium]MDW8461016.1 NAD-dependent epimerase/dehydratase family protein [Cytophagales bacterium]